MPCTRLTFSGMPGGSCGYPGDGSPGWQTLWRGLERLQALLEGILFPLPFLPLLLVSSRQIRHPARSKPGEPSPWQEHGVAERERKRTGLCAGNGVGPRASARHGKCCACLQAARSTRIFWLNVGAGIVRVVVRMGVIEHWEMPLFQVMQSSPARVGE